LKNSIAACAVILFATMFPAGGQSAEESAFSDPSKTVEAALGSEFSIVLESNQTTGFGWDISKPLDEKVVRFVSSEYVASSAAMPGAPGREIWTFRACAAGKTAISFRYVRPWEKDVPPVKKADFDVVVK
jgi:inhibitor of cysteine peptidase